LAWARKLKATCQQRAGWNCEARNAESNARCRDVAVHGSFLRPGVSLRQGLPKTEVAPMQFDVITVVALVLSVLLLGYLTITLLFPEKF
jgi:K+-transporting ATPase KdpF subunit